MVGFSLLLFVVCLSSVPLDLPRPLRQSALPRLPHTAALGVPEETRGIAVEVGERGASKNALLETSKLIAGTGGGLQRFWRPLQPATFYFPHALIFH